MSATLQNPDGAEVHPAHPSIESALHYRPAIDGLRAIAVLSVFIFHLNRNWMPGGFVGVDVFFVISGFLITSILLRKYDHSSYSLWKFYQRRIARLFPAFFTVAIVTLIAAFFVYSAQDLARCGAALVSATLSVANMKYMLQGNYFKISPDAQPLIHFWSLSVEEQFYLFFPAILWVLYLRANRHKTAILAVLFGASLVACIALTYRKPEWAFYLLPTRAWELLAGAILANLTLHRSEADGNAIAWRSLSLAGLVLVIASLYVIHEGPGFPGYRAILPVLGTVCILGSKGGSRNWTEKLLSTAPMVFIGRISYSLYLWHWPVFSFVDYELYLQSPLVRIGSKIFLSAAASILCFFLIENPGRVFLNHPRRRRTAFAFLAVALVVCVPLGIAVRDANYVDAKMGSVVHGGVGFNQASRNGSMVLMGDSNGSMYGTMVKNVARELQFKLNVITVDGKDPLPDASGQDSRFWLDSLTFVKRDHPDVLVLVCNWAKKLKGDKTRLEIAINELKQHTRHLVLISQPPRLPDNASREAMRQGSRPPFREDPAERAVRIESNRILKTYQHDNVVVVDIEPLFALGDGSIRFANDDGVLLYQDEGHLSDAGADRVRSAVIKAIRELKTGN
jgi:peptidoglycan/LPS O-acetylase OafA/YrhL/ribosomal protein L21E